MKSIIQIQDGELSFKGKKVLDRIIHQPTLLILDEPTAALDLIARNEIKSLIATLAQTGISVVFTSHDMSEVEKLAERIVFIKSGRVCYEGTVDQLGEVHYLE